MPQTNQCHVISPIRSCYQISPTQLQPPARSFQALEAETCNTWQAGAHAHLPVVQAKPVLEVKSYTLALSPLKLDLNKDNVGSQLKLFLEPICGFSH